MRKTMKKLSLLVLAVCVAGVSPALAQEQPPPEGGGGKGCGGGGDETYTVPNGMKVTLVPYGIIPKATLSLAVYAGGIDEGSARVGVAGLTADLMKEGTEKL